MSRALILIAAILVLSPEGAIAQDSNPVQVIRPAPVRGPLKDGASFEIACKADPAREGAGIASSTATIWIPLSFNATNAETRLKFYDADILFEGDSAPLRIRRATLTGNEEEMGHSRFGDLRLRTADDDFPTTFVRGGQLYEIQATSTLPRKRTRRDSFAINFRRPFSLVIETVPSDGSTRNRAWAGACTFNDPKTAS